MPGELMAELDRMRSEMPDAPDRSSLVRRWIAENLESHARKRSYVARTVRKRKREPVPWNMPPVDHAPGG